MENAVFEGKNIGLLWHKPPYFRGKTSVLCGREVRCFPFSGRKLRVNPSFPVLRYFRPRQGVVASVALLGPLTTWSGRENIAENARRKKLHIPPGCGASKAPVYVDSRLSALLGAHIYGERCNRFIPSTGTSHDLLPREPWCPFGIRQPSSEPPFPLPAIISGYGGSFVSASPKVSPQLSVRLLPVHPPHIDSCPNPAG